MGRKCVVPNCRSGYNNNPEKISLFYVPKDKLNKWQRAIPRGDRLLTERDNVCAKHFVKEDIITEADNYIKRNIIKLFYKKKKTVAIHNNVNATQFHNRFRWQNSI